MRVSGWRLVGLTLFLAGGASNWFDRATRGSVVDFISVGLGPVRTGIFNVADVAILLGVALVMIEEVAPASCRAAPRCTSRRGPRRGVRS